MGKIWINKGVKRIKLIKSIRKRIGLDLQSLDIEVLDLIMLIIIERINKMAIGRIKRIYQIEGIK